MLTHSCLTCSATFTRPNNPNRPYRFCSYKCRAVAFKTERATKECAHCNAPFPVWPHEQSIRVTCSKECAARHRDQGRTTAAFRLRTSTAYANWRKAVFARDCYTCQECGQVGGKLNADHIKRFSDYPELRLDVSNGRTLCVPCHLATPTFGNRKAAA